MALAIIGVVFSHSNHDFGWSFFNRLTAIGYGGVDIFFFLSGFGLFYSSLKKTSAIQFYKKRILRILPAYLLVMLIKDLCAHTLSFSFFLEASTLGFWLPWLHWPYFAWFIPSIMMFYLVFPLFIKFFHRHPIYATLAGILLGCLLSTIYTYTFTFVYPKAYNALMLFTSRIPIFCIGVFLGYLTSNKSKEILAKRIMIVSIPLFAIGFFTLNVLMDHYDYVTLRNYGLLYYPFILIVPGFCILAGWIMSLQWLPDFIRKALIPIGKTTLETYLIHGTLFTFVSWVTYILQCPLRLSYLIIIASSLCAGYLIHYVIEYIESKIH